MLIALLALLSTATASHALTCEISEQPIAIALCDGGVCSEGFAVVYVSVEPNGGCQVRPVVRELSEASLDVFAQSARLSPPLRLSGIYEAEISCRGYRSLGERCVTPTSIKRLSERIDRRTLDAHRSEWKDAERQAYRSHLLRYGGGIAILVSLTLLVIGWPWALGAVAPAVRRHIGKTLLVAIPLQLLMYFLLYGVSTPYLHYGSGPFEGVGRWCSILIAVAIPLQLIAFVRRKYKARAGPA